MTWTMGILLALGGQDAEFTRELMKKPRATLGDACMVFSALLPGEGTAKTPQEAADRLVKAGRMPASWKESLGGNASLGEVAYLICTHLKIKGGLVMRFTGYTPRYCYRECVARRLLKANGPHSGLTGRDLLGLYGALEQAQEAAK